MVYFIGLSFLVLFQSYTASALSLPRRSLFSNKKCIQRSLSYVDRRVLLFSQTQDSEQNPEDGDFLFPDDLTPNQMKIVRKEVSARRRQKKLATYFLVENEGVSDDFRDESIQAVRKLLEKEEIVEVRAISKNDIKLVLDVVYNFIDIIGPEVFVIAKKGHAAVLFQQKNKGGLKLYKRKPVFAPKLKPVRDEDGIIIPGEYA